MPVSLTHSPGVRPTVLPPAPRGARGPAPTTPATQPPVGPATTPGAASSSPPIEQHASNLRFGGAGLPRPAAPRAPTGAAARPPGSGRSGTPAELRLRFQQEASTFEGVSFDLSPPEGTSWADAKQEFEQHYQAARAQQRFAEADSDPLPPTMRKPAGPAAGARGELSPTLSRGTGREGTAPGGGAPHGSSGTKATAPVNRSAFDGVDFDLDNDPDLKKELLALNARHAPPQAKASSVPPDPQRGATTTWKAGVFARTRSASQGDVPRPTPTGTGQDSPARRATKKEGGLREALKRWWSEPGVRVSRSRK
ncbi:MAG: hypothetical protein GXD23_16135 [Comamonadaceae bacterium]|jgi:hypothetical protein|nr:hypothetical protein [Comamonadaceae bacterium]